MRGGLELFEETDVVRIEVQRRMKEVVEQFDTTFDNCRESRQFCGTFLDSCYIRSNVLIQC